MARARRLLTPVPLVSGLSLVLAVFLCGSVAGAASDRTPPDKAGIESCKNGGWVAQNFANQSQCVSFYARGGTTTTTTPASTTTTSTSTTSTSTTSTSTTSTSTTTTTIATNVTPSIYVGYADDLHGAPFVPTPWQGNLGIVYLGCTAGTPECGSLDGGAIRVVNPATNGSLTLLNAYVDIGPCHFHPWDAMLGQSAAGGGAFILTQTGLLGPPQASPCDGRVSPALRPLTNFDTSEGPYDTISPPYSNCDPTLVPPPVITLMFSGFTLTITDSAKVLSTGGVDRFACSGLEEGTQWAVVTPADIART